MCVSFFLSFHIVQIICQPDLFKLIRTMGELIAKVYESYTCSSSLIMLLFQNADIQLEPLGSKTKQWGDQETLRCPSEV